MAFADDQVIEQPDVEDVRCRAEPDGQSSVVWTRSFVAARMVVDDDQSRRAGHDTGRHEDVGYRDRRARSRTPRQDVPGQEAVLRGEARHSEHFNELIREQWPKRRRRRVRGVQDQRRHINDATIVVSQRSVGADELSNSMSGDSVNK